MGQILGLGVTHYPGLGMQGNLAARMKNFMHDPLLPEQYRSPETWPEPMRNEWSTDEGLAHSDRHRAALIENMRWAREELDRKGFPYPLLPLAVNSYGRGLIKLHGSVLNNLAYLPQNEDEYDPPSPQPWRCFDLGRAVARAMSASPWRVALIASSSWSHSFLTSKTWYTHADVESDRYLFEAMKAGEWDKWRSRPLEEVEASGHHELLNWFCLMGAMSELGRRPQEARFLESYLCNSDKVFTVFHP
jgi:hypothetical protein